MGIMDSQKSRALTELFNKEKAIRARFEQQWALENAPSQAELDLQAELEEEEARKRATLGTSTHPRFRKPEVPEKPPPVTQDEKNKHMLDAISMHLGANLYGNYVNDTAGRKSSMKATFVDPSTLLDEEETYMLRTKPNVRHRDSFTNYAEAAARARNIELAMRENK